MKVHRPQVSDDLSETQREKEGQRVGAGGSPASAVPQKVAELLQFCRRTRTELSKFRIAELFLYFRTLFDRVFERSVPVRRSQVPGAGEENTNRRDLGGYRECHQPKWMMIVEQAECGAAQQPC